MLAHARALLTGRTAYIEADLRDPDRILAAAAETLDFDRPIALLLVGVLHFIPGEGAAKPLVDRLVAALPTGSFVVVTHVTNDFLPPSVVEGVQGNSDFWMRPKAEIAELFDGLELLEPGVVPTTEWRPESKSDLPLHVVNAWAAVGRVTVPAAANGE